MRDHVTFHALLMSRFVLRTVEHGLLSTVSTNGGVAAFHPQELCGWVLSQNRRGGVSGSCPVVQQGAVFGGPGGSAPSLHREALFLMQARLIFPVRAMQLWVTSHQQWEMC